MIFAQYRFIGKLYTLYLSCTVLLMGMCASQKNFIYRDDPNNILTDSTRTILYVFIDNIEIKYSDNTKLIPDTQFTDSFFTEAANGLLNFECAKYFTICSYYEGFKELKDSIALLYNKRYSHLARNTNDYDSVSALMKRTAEKFKVDLILLPYSCNIKHITFQPKGWREAPNYQHPVKYKAKTEIHLQIWDKNGKLLYERIGKSDTGRPILYSFFKKAKPDEDVIRYVKRFYAPPLIKSLSKAIIKAMNIKQHR